MGKYDIKHIHSDRNTAVPSCTSGVKMRTSRQTNLLRGDVSCKKLCQPHYWLCRYILHFVLSLHQTTPALPRNPPEICYTCPPGWVRCYPWTSWRWKEVFLLRCLWKWHWLRLTRPWPRVSEQRMVALNKKLHTKSNLIFLNFDDNLA